MNQPLAAVTDVPQLITDLEAGLFDRRMSVALSQVAASVVDTSKPGKVTVVFTLTSIKGTNQIACKHAIAYEKPLERGVATETDTGETVLYVGKAGAITLAQPGLPGMADARQAGLV